MRATKRLTILLTIYTQIVLFNKAGAQSVNLVYIRKALNRKEDEKHCDILEIMSFEMDMKEAYCTVGHLYLFIYIYISLNFVFPVKTTYIKSKYFLSTC